MLTAKFVKNVFQSLGIIFSSKENACMKITQNNRDLNILMTSSQLDTLK